MLESARDQSSETRFLLWLSRLVALRPTLRSLGITQAQLDQEPEIVLERYAGQMIEFFCTTDVVYGNRWEHLSRKLEQRLSEAKVTDAAASSLIAQVVAYPDSDERAEALGPPVALVYHGLHRGCLALAIVAGAGSAVVFTLAHGVEVFDSPASLKRASSLLLTEQERLDDHVFDGWALAALEAGLQRVDRIDVSASPTLEQLDRRLAWATRFGDFLEQDIELDSLRSELEQQLPEWLKDAPAEGRLAYSRLLSAMARVHERSRGKCFLDDLSALPARDLNVETREGLRRKQQFAPWFAVQLRRLVLECSLQNPQDVTLEAYLNVQAALERHDRLGEGGVMVFRSLDDGPGYIIGPQAIASGPWIVFRPWAQEVVRQVAVLPEAGLMLADPLLEIFKDCVQRWLPDSTAVIPASAYGTGWARSQGMLPMFEHPLQTLARLKQVGGNLVDEPMPALAKDWLRDANLLRNLAVLLVYPGTPQTAALLSTHKREKRMDSFWAGHRGFSGKQAKALKTLGRQSLSKRGTLIEDGEHRGLHLLNDALVYNNDQNTNNFCILSIHCSFNDPQHEHRVAVEPGDSTIPWPDIAPAADRTWHIVRTPRQRRDTQGVNPRAQNAMRLGAGVSATLATRLRDASRQALAPGARGVLVEEQLERDARQFDAAAVQIRRFTQNRSTQASSAQVSVLERQAQQLREQGRSLRVELCRRTPTPTLEDVQYLSGLHLVDIRRVNGRVPEVIDGVTDYLQEFEVRDVQDGKPLWFAHFHYPTLETPDAQPTKAHLKTTAQRRQGREFERVEAGAGRSARVYRGPITTLTGREFFLRNV